LLFSPVLKRGRLMAGRTYIIRIAGGLVLGTGMIAAQAQQTRAANTLPAGAVSERPGSHTNSTNTPGGAPVPEASFVVGTGDVLAISVWREKDLSPTVTIRPDGRITVPLVGELFVSGLTPLQIEGVLRQRLDTIVVHPQVNVTVVEVHSRMVYITGEVAHPGGYALTTPLNVLQLIAQAGGLTQFASRKKIQVLHAGKGEPAAVFAYKQLTQSDDEAHLYPLLPGDTVVVP
jgi:polysaccharide export outer membrane protein